MLVQLTGGWGGAFGELLNWPIGKHEEDNIRHFSGDKMTRRLTRYLTPYKARATVSLHAWWDKKHGKRAAKRRLETSTSAAALNNEKSWGRHDMNHCHAMIHPTYSRRKKLYLDFCLVCVKAAARISLLDSGRPRRFILDQRARNGVREENKLVLNIRCLSTVVLNTKIREKVVTLRPCHQNLIIF